MNERIQELAEQAGFSVVETQGTGETTLWAFDDEPIDDELQKFAELIIQECIRLGEESQYKCRTFPVSVAIKEHFGVK